MKDSFKNYFQELIGPDEAEQFFDSIKKKDTRRALRVNTLKTDKESLRSWLSSQGYEVTDSPFSKDGLEISGRGKPLSLKLPYHAGFTYPQDPSSMFAVEVLDPQPGETVLDLTAAPGGKTTHIAQRMKNTGVLMANDMDTRRLRALQSNLERLGVWNTIVVRMTPHKLSMAYPESFDRILLDPSCSGEGLLVTRDGQADYWSPKSLKRYANDQISLLCSAFRLLKPGGRLVYSTCTLNAIEDDGIVERLMKKFPEAEIENVKVDGTPEQIANLKGLRFWPHKTRTKGFFCIAITKTESLGLDPVGESQHFKSVKKKQLLGYTKYVENTFGVELPDVRWILRDGHLFMISPELLGFDLPWKYSLSFPLLKVDGDLKPTFSGAKWLALHAKKSVLELSRENVESVFEREALQNVGDDRGLFLARYQNFPVGIAKCTDTRVYVDLPKQF